MYITNNSDVALIAEKFGVDRIWIDLETLGKEKRQCNMNTVKSHHTVKDVEKMSGVLTKSELLVRVNPINECSQNEIDEVIQAGANIIMLPMWKTVDDVSSFLKFVNGRAKTILLLETKEAVQCIDDVLQIGGFDEIHIGLNDLHLSYKLNFMFELLANGTVEMLCNKIKKTSVKYGFGGIARLGSGALPAEKIIAEHYRLGSTMAILSRSFCNSEEITDLAVIEKIFGENIAKLRAFENDLANMDNTFFSQNLQAIKTIVEQIVENIGSRENDN